MKDGYEERMGELRRKLEGVALELRETRESLVEMEDKLARKEGKEEEGALGGREERRFMLCREG